jgi:hypothetical protein
VEKRVTEEGTTERRVSRRGKAKPEKRNGGAFEWFLATEAKRWERERETEERKSGGG